jgi:hypothetical protein
VSDRFDREVRKVVDALIESDQEPNDFAIAQVAIAVLLRRIATEERERALSDAIEACSAVEAEYTLSPDAAGGAAHCVDVIRVLKGDE